MAGARVFWLSLVRRCGVPVIAVVVMVVVIGCAGNDRSVDREKQMDKAEARTDVHKRVDPLAKQVGTNPEKTREGTAGMDPKAPVKSYELNVRVDIDDDTWEHVRGPIADDLRKKGYTVREHADETRMRFLSKDGRRTLGINVFPDDGYANIGGASDYAADE